MNNQNNTGYLKPQIVANSSRIGDSFLRKLRLGASRLLKIERRNEIMNHCLAHPAPPPFLHSEKLENFSVTLDRSSPFVTVHVTGTKPDLSQVSNRSSCLP